MANLVRTDFNQQGINALNKGLGIGEAIQRNKQIDIDRGRQQESDRQQQQLFGQQTQMNQQKIDQQESLSGMGEMITALNLPYEKRQELFSELESTKQNPAAKKAIAHLRTLGDEEQLTTMMQMISDQQGGDNEGRSTSAIKNQEYYNNLKKSDPESAELFASSAGLTTGKDGGKPRLFKVIKNDDGTLTKIFTDGSEKVTTQNRQEKTDDMKSSISAKQAYNVLDKAKEASLKNGGFAINMRNGFNTLEKLDAKGFRPKDIAMVQTYLSGGSLGNYIMSADEQVYAGAIESMINSIARRESGAAIGEEETQRFFRRYMPQAGDTEARLNQKRKSLETQFKSIRGQSGRVYDALRVTMGIDSDNPNNQEKSDQPSGGANIIIKSHPVYGDVSEEDIQETMKQSGMTREQVLSKLGG